MWLIVDQRTLTFHYDNNSEYSLLYIINYTIRYYYYSERQSRVAEHSGMSLRTSSTLTCNSYILYDDFVITELALDTFLVFKY